MNILTYNYEQSNAKAESLEAQKTKFLISPTFS